MGEKSHGEARHDEERRKLLAGGAAALPQLLLGGAPGEDCARPPRGPHDGYFPQVVLVSHDKRQALFYDDLLLGRSVLVHCFSQQNEAEYPVAANLARVQDHLGERLGKDVFIYSLAIDPRRDGLEELAGFARQIGARDGWLFLTGHPDDMALLKSRLFVHGRGVHHDFARDCSRGLLRYGNESIGLWGALPARSEPGAIAQRLAWIAPRDKEPGGAPRRRGPSPGWPFPGAGVWPGTGG